MNVLATIEAALAQMAQGRSTITAVVDAIRDGQTAISTTDMGKLNQLLAQEKQETEAAHNALARAIEAAQSK